MQLSGCWLDTDFRDFDDFWSHLLAGSALTFLGFPKVTSAEAMANPAEKKASHNITSSHVLMFRP